MAAVVQIAVEQWAKEEREAVREMAERAPGETTQKPEAAQKQDDWAEEVLAEQVLAAQKNLGEG